MLFLLDHDVDALVGHVIRKAGHECETAASVGLATADDDSLSVYADNVHAVLVTHDREAMGRRLLHTFGKHVWLACSDLNAVEVLADHLDEVIDLLPTRDAILIKVTRHVVKALDNRWK